MGDSDHMIDRADTQMQWQTEQFTGYQVNNFNQLPSQSHTVVSKHGGDQEM